MEFPLQFGLKDSVQYQTLETIAFNTIGRRLSFDFLIQLLLIDFLCSWVACWNT